ncbi:myosin heavy chain type 2 [Penaeus vannamei]|uniref:Paramyosin n=1 Tax=Penaeus vannamei TaxID=6689 RepID=A0A423SX18_PENVA|nr:myosin heavy chain type 2 [Penaeus vannamei]
MEARVKRSALLPNIANSMALLNAVTTPSIAETLLEQSDRVVAMLRLSSTMHANRSTTSPARMPLSADLEEMLSEAKNSEEKAKKAMLDAARLADELRSEQEHASNQEKMRKGLEVTVKDLQNRLQDSEASALKTGKKAASELEGRIRDLEASLDDETRRHADAQKNLRKCERRIKELAFQTDEDKKNHDRMQDLVDKSSRRSRLTSARSRRLRRSPPSTWPSSARLSRERGNREKANKTVQQQIGEVNVKWDEANRTLNDFDAMKKKLAVENGDLLRQLEEADNQISQLNNLKSSLTTQLEDTKKMVEDESRERGVLLGKFRNLEHDLDGLREQLDEESEAKADANRQLSRVHAEAQMWRSKYESEGVARAEEIEAARLKLLLALRKLNCRLNNSMSRICNWRRFAVRDKCLAEEIKDLMEQISEGGRSLHEIEKMASALRLRRRSCRLPSRRLKQLSSRKKTRSFVASLSSAR